MTGPRRTMPPCPSCGGALGPRTPYAQAPGRCPSCGVPWEGETAQRLLALDQRIASLSAERRELLARLRQEAAVPAPPATTRPTTGAVPPVPRTTDAAAPPPRAAGAAAAASPAEVPAPRSAAADRVRAWLATAGPQTLLAVGGVLLLAVAALVFTAVTWRDLPMLARGGVLLTAAAGSGRLTAALARRDLVRTAEATGALTIVLLAVVCNGLWRAGLLDGIGDGTAVLSVTTALLALVSHALAQLTPVASPRVLAAWLGGVAAHAGGLWLTSPYVDLRIGALAVLVVLAVDLVAALVAGTYAVRYLTVVPRWRVATFVVAGALWLGTAVGAPSVLAGLTPGATSDLPAFAVGLGVVVASVGLAAAARRIAGPLAAWWPVVGAAGMWLAATMGAAGALVDRLTGWPQLPIVVPFALGVAAAARTRTVTDRAGAALGLLPIGVASLLPVVTTIGWVLGVVEAVETVRATAPDVVAVASAVAVSVIAASFAVVVDRRQPGTAASTRDGNGDAADPLAGLRAGAHHTARWLCALAWVSAVAGASVALALLTPSRVADLQLFVACAALLVVLAATATAARTLRLVRRGVAAGGVTLVVTAGAAGALTDRLAAWPELPVVVPLAIGVAMVWRHRPGGSRTGALVGLAPVGIAALAPVAAACEWIADVLIQRVVSPWPPDVVVSAPGAVALASALAVCALLACLGAVTHGRRATVAVGIVGGLVLLAAGTAVWPVGGGAAVALVGLAAATVAARGAPVPRLMASAAVVLSVVAVAAALTVPSVTIATLAVAAALTAVALPVRDARAARVVAGLVTAHAIGLGAAVAAAATRAPAPTGMTVVCAAAVAWLAAAATRRHADHAIAVEVTAAAAFAIGLALTAGRGGVWLGAALAVLAVAAAAVAVWRPDRRWMQWVAAASASAASWSVLADRGVDVVEAYTAPPALLLVGLAARRLRAHPTASSWPVMGSGLGMLTAPTVLQLLGDPADLPRLAVALTLGAALVVGGRVWALQSPVVVGVTTSAVAALTQHAVVTAVLPRWVLLAVAGALLLWLSSTYEVQRVRLTAARRRLAALR